MGGMGFFLRDVIFEVILEVIEKFVLGFLFVMLSELFKVISMVMLFRVICGIRKKIVIINLLGSFKGF